MVALAKAAKVFNVPTTITTVETESFSGHTYPELLAVYPEHKILERTSMNSWDDQNVRDALAATGRKKIVVSGLWTEVCNLMFALSAMKDGDYEIYMVADASGATSADAQKYAMDRMVQAGVIPGHLAAGAARMAARLGTQEDLRRDHRASCRSIPALTAWASIMPTRWCTRRRSA